MDQIIIHVDMDAFFASVEIRDKPSLRGRPLIIGSLPNERGVVATCNYEARKYGVHSAMNIKEAYRLCPQGIYLHPNYGKYKAVSEQLHEIWEVNSSAMEAIALDEAYLDVTDIAADFDEARKIAYVIKQRIRDELSLPCSVGVAYSKTAAKAASEERKPDGYYEIRTKEDFIELIQNRDVRSLYMVGEKTAEKLNAIGIHSVRDVWQKKETVIQLLGKQGRWIVDLSQGIDNRKVTPYRPENAKSISREITFQEDVSDYVFLKDVLFLLSVCVEDRVKRLGLFGKGVNLKIKYADMKSISRSIRSEHPDTAIEIYEEAERLLDRIKHKPVRLIGVGVYDLSSEKYRQLRLDDVLQDRDRIIAQVQNDFFSRLQERYQLVFAGHVSQLLEPEIFYKTIEYMRKNNTMVLS